MSIHLSEADLVVLRRDGVRISSVDGKPLKALANISPESAYLSSIDKHLEAILTALERKPDVPTAAPVDLTPLNGRLGSIITAIEQSTKVMQDVPKEIARDLPAPRLAPIKAWNFQIERDTLNDRIKTITATSGPNEPEKREWLFTVQRNDEGKMTGIRATLKQSSQPQPTTKNAEWSFTIQRNEDGKMTGVKAVAKPAQQER